MKTERMAKGKSEPYFKIYSRTWTTEVILKSQ